MYHQFDWWCFQYGTGLSKKLVSHSLLTNKFSTTLIAVIFLQTYKYWHLWGQDRQCVSWSNHRQRAPNSLQHTTQSALKKLRTVCHTQHSQFFVLFDLLFWVRSVKTVVMNGFARTEVYPSVCNVMSFRTRGGFNLNRKENIGLDQTKRK